MLGVLGVLGVLSALMGFASISTDVYLTVMPAMSRDLGTTPGSLALVWSWNWLTT